ncbi:MAG: tRNA uridine-5-carboxymethylaminomethyl(34) synthesis GTPase MnmE [Gemmatimonadales bacterium]|nr:MAG: tRNA uridine-5-carboxymethylaminomethyl(34) synthesis GTPase MnmE [Gemmatimonadales bacterium]
MGGDAVRVDTIVAAATPPGRGAVAVVRVSGPDALPFTCALVPVWRSQGTGPSARRATLALLRDPHHDAALDRGLITFFPGPASYTGEDLVEIGVHGSPLLVELLVEALVGLGARRAAHGEFTRRAYLNGKLDLIRAEGVADLIEADSEAAHQVAVHQVEGGLSHRLNEIRSQLLEVEALVMHHVDFPDEDDPPVPLSRILEAAQRVERRLEALLASAPEGELLREGASVVLAGRPNAGKSSLYNALLGEERAIVTAEAGTTRDALEARLSIGGFPFRLVDTAGLRTQARGIERYGIEVAERYLGGADVILLCLSASWSWGEEEEEFLRRWGRNTPLVRVRTQVDTVGAQQVPDWVVEPGTGPVASVSVRTGEGLGQLRGILKDLAFRGIAAKDPAAPVLTRRRQREAVARARDLILGFQGALAGGIPAEAAILDVREAEGALGELVGSVVTDDVLDQVFRRFCIGK